MACILEEPYVTLPEEVVEFLKAQEFSIHAYNEKDEPKARVITDTMRQILSDPQSLPYDMKRKIIRLYYDHKQDCLNALTRNFLCLHQDEYEGVLRFPIADK